MHTFQPEVPSDWLVVDADKEVLALTCPADLQGVKEEDIVVWVDPLDGTSEYTQGKLLVFYYSDMLFIYHFIYC